MKLKRPEAAYPMIIAIAAVILIAIIIAIISFNNNNKDEAPQAEVKRPEVTNIQQQNAGKDNNDAQTEATTLDNKTTEQQAIDHVADIIELLGLERICGEIKTTWSTPGHPSNVTANCIIYGDELVGNDKIIIKIVKNKDINFENREQPGCINSCWSRSH